MASDDKPTLGLRERKKAKTRASIQKHALRLFHSQGYHNTTVEHIAEAAEISPSTFFRYFPTKEDVVLNDELDPLIIEAFYAQPAELHPIDAMRGAMKSVFDSVTPEDLASELERSKLIMAVPEVRAAFLNNFSDTIRLLSEVVAKRVGRDASDIAIRSLAGALFGAGISLVFSWIENPDTDLFGALDEAFNFLKSGFSL